MNTAVTRTATTIIAASAAILAACGGSGSGETATTGFLSLAVSDGPIHEAVKVCVEFNEIELKSGSETTIIELDPPQKVNLLDYQGANAAPLLMDYEVPAGDYQWMRLGVNAERGSNGGVGDSDPTNPTVCDGEASYLVMNEMSTYNLYIPSGANTGLKLVSGFTVPANGSPDFTAEWDLMKSIRAPGGLAPDVLMKPVIRLVNNVDVGTLTGDVLTDLATAEACEPSVFLFDDGVTPNPIGIDTDPESTEVDPNDAVATAMVNEQMNDDGSVEWNYTIGFLLEGEYEAAFTCDGTTFEPEAGKPASIVPGEIETVNFGFDE